MWLHILSYFRHQVVGRFSKEIKCTDLRPFLQPSVRFLLTDGGNDGGDEVEGSGEIPSDPCVVRDAGVSVPGEQTVQVGSVDRRI